MGVAFAVGLLQLIGELSAVLTALLPVECTNVVMSQAEIELFVLVVEVPPLSVENMRPRVTATVVVSD